MTVEFPQAVEIAARVKLRPRPARSWSGGAHVNAVGRQALLERRGVRLRLRRRGRVARAASWPTRSRAAATRRPIPGLVSRRDGEVVAGPPRPYPDDYDALPFPAWDLFRPLATLPLLTHRGCPFQCIVLRPQLGLQAAVPHARERPRRARATPWSATARAHPHRGRDLRPPHGPDEGDPRGDHRPRHPPPGAVLGADARRPVDEEFMRLLKTANFETLELGVESGNPEVLKRTSRRGSRSSRSSTPSRSPRPTACGCGASSSSATRTRRARRSATR